MIAVWNGQLFLAPFILACRGVRHEEKDVVQYSVSWLHRYQWLCPSSPTVRMSDEQHHNCAGASDIEPKPPMTLSARLLQALGKIDVCTSPDRHDSPSFAAGFSSSHSVAYDDRNTVCVHAHSAQNYRCRAITGNPPCRTIGPADAAALHVCGDSILPAHVQGGAGQAVHKETACWEQHSEPGTLLPPCVTETARNANEARRSVSPTAVQGGAARSHERAELSRVRCVAQALTEHLTELLDGPICPAHNFDSGGSNKSC